MIYLCCPYSHVDPTVREARFDAACRAAAALMRAGKMVFSAISHTHPIAQYGLPKGWDFWEAYDRELLQRCEEVVVLMLDGWQRSVGVQAEIKIARQLGKPVSYLTPVTEENPDACRG